MKLEENVHTFLGDMVTPVAVYSRLRHVYPGCCFLESADFHPDENCSTYICVNPKAEFRASDQAYSIGCNGASKQVVEVVEPSQFLQGLKDFVNSFDISRSPKAIALGLANGFFGYTAYDAVQSFEDIRFTQELEPERQVPSIQYQVFEFVIAINHYRSEMHVIHNLEKGEDKQGIDARLNKLIRTIFHGDSRSFGFKRTGQEVSNFSDDEHMNMISKCKEHIARGDVFQIVPSRRFSQSYKGDDFEVYRALRSINPSPYLFYFDYGDFRIFGSSPEAEIIVKGNTATISPIAGTYPRFSDQKIEAAKIKELIDDPKENAEHVMLVDLARNDLSKHCTNVSVDTYREVQKFSHVIHLVSSVSGTMDPAVQSLDILADTFPAGTLSGAPKHEAMTLIDRYERGARGVYGGALGFIDFNGDIIHAIMIRTFLSKGNVLYRQAGGGVVSDSVLEAEVAEVKNKLGALAAALEMAEEMDDEVISPR